MLGPLPKGRHVEDDLPYRETYEMRFVNNATGESVVEDPRLPQKLPVGWTSKLDSDGDGFFVEVASGRKIWEDPRLFDINFLRSRGVDVQDILLV